MKDICIFLIKLYQKFISPLFLPRCRYYPTCSSYMVDSLHKYGVFKGFLKGVYRIIRCNPFSSGGHDPA